MSEVHVARLGEWKSAKLKDAVLVATLLRRLPGSNFYKYEVKESTMHDEEGSRRCVVISVRATDGDELSHDERTNIRVMFVALMMGLVASGRIEAPVWFAESYDCEKV